MEYTSLVDLCRITDCTGNEDVSYPDMSDCQIQTQIRSHTDSDGFQAGSHSKNEHHRSSDLLHTHPHLQRENNCSITTHNTLMLTNHTTRFIVLDAGCLKGYNRCLGVHQTCHSGAGEIKHASILPFVMTEEDSEGCRPCLSAWEQAWGSGWVKSWSAGDLVLIIANYREGKEHTVPLSLLIFLCSLSLTPFLSTLEWRVQTGDKIIL